jgi:hypothetical protein
MPLIHINEVFLDILVLMNLKGVIHHEGIFRENKGFIGTNCAHEIYIFWKNDYFP